MITFQPIFLTSGVLLTALAGAMLIPAAVDIYADDIHYQAFLMASAPTFFTGVLLILGNRSAKKTTFSLRDTFLMTFVCWVLTSFFAALPFVFSGITNGFTDSLFEATSALTTTGATVIQGLDFTSGGIILWRSLLQWLGGIGIVVMAMTVLPTLRIGGMQLFRTEFSDRSEKILPKVSQIASAVLSTYFFLTVLCAVCLWGAGMSFFESVCHGLSTLSTGGFSCYDRSISFFESPLIEGILIVFMAIGGMTLLLWVRFWHRDWGAFWHDSQTRFYIGLMGFSTVLIVFWEWQSGQDFWDAFRHGLFNVVSIVTTTGYHSTDYTLWTTFSVMMFFALTMVGGCTGSTSGGIKIFRYQVMMITARAQIQKLSKPSGVFLSLYNGKQMPDGLFLSVFTFFAFFLVSFLMLVLGLALHDLDILTCLSGAMTALNNVGPGFGSVIGPKGNYGILPDGAKWLLMFGMILGRLEYLTVIVLFSPRFWRS